MRNFCKIGIALFFGLLTGCTTASLEELRQATPTGDAFQSALSREYLAFSESEARQYDWISSKHFADKGLYAAYGKTVPPETLEKWDIDEAYLPELREARAALMAALTSGSPATQPELAARTQFFFDCWVEQQHEAWQVDDIASCKEGFYRALKRMQGAPVAQDPEPAENDEPLIFSSSYIVFFDWNTVTLKAEALGVIDTVVDDLKGEESYEIILHGHADRSGTVEYNLKLSQKRAVAVKTALVERGIADNLITYYAFGESDNRIPTADGVREKANRRVEIFFNQ